MWSCDYFLLQIMNIGRHEYREAYMKTTIRCKINNTYYNKPTKSCSWIEFSFVAIFKSSLYNERHLLPPPTTHPIKTINIYSHYHINLSVTLYNYTYIPYIPHVSSIANRNFYNDFMSMKLLKTIWEKLKNEDKHWALSSNGLSYSPPHLFIKRSGMILAT